MITETLFIIIGFVFLIGGADFLVKSSTSIAKKFGLSQMVIGLTIVAIGTSLPEIFVTITSAAGGHADLIIGNAVGSCLCNFLLVIGITSLVKPVRLDKRIVKRHFPIGMAAMVLLLFLGNTKKFGGYQTITRGQGVLLLLCTFLYIMYTIYEEKEFRNKRIDKEILEDVDSKDDYSTHMIIFGIVIGFLGLKFGADFVVDNCVLIASRLGLSERVIGMTIIAIGTALPEIVTGIVAARRDETDLLLGNISSSNILNLCLLIGLGAVIRPLHFTANFNFSIILLIAITVFLQLIATVGKKNDLSSNKGFVLILIYILYIWHMI